LPTSLIEIVEVVALFVTLNMALPEELETVLKDIWSAGRVDELLTLLAVMVAFVSVPVSPPPLKVKAHSENVN
jgi:hypothetical protein